MADTKISALTAVTTPAGTDELAVNEAGTSKKLTLAQVNTFCDPISMSSTSETGFAADTYVTGSALTVDPARLQAATFWRFLCEVEKTAAGIAAPVFSLRMGTAGSTADTAILTFTGGAQTAVIDRGRLEILAGFTSVGSGTSAVVAGVLILQHTNSSTGLTTSGAAFPAPIKVTSSGFNSTTVTKIGLSINAGASAAWTLACVQTELRHLI